MNDVSVFKLWFYWTVSILLMYWVGYYRGKQSVICAYLYWVTQRDRLRGLIQAWMDKQSHDRCWYYPDIFREIAITLDMNLSNPTGGGLPARTEFEFGCRKYQDEEYGVDNSQNGS